jgi:hypothetical protein
MTNDMNREQLQQAFKQDIARYGDGSGIDPAEIVAAARRLSRAEKMRRGIGGVAALAVAGGGAFAFASAPAAAADWTLSPAPDRVNERIVELVKDQLPTGVAVSDLEMEAFAKAKPGQKDLDGLGIALPRSKWSEADAWATTVELDSGVKISVTLAHSRGETEGDAKALCAEILADGNVEVCDAGTTSRRDQAVDTVWREGPADRTADGFVWGPGELAKIYPDDTPASTAVRDASFEAQPGGDFVIRVSQISPVGTEPVLDAEAMADVALNRGLLHAN